MYRTQIPATAYAKRRTATASAPCAAIQEANVHPGPDIIQLQAGVTYLLTRAGVDDNALNGDLDITETVTILGAGPDRTIIDGNGGVTGERVFQITGTVVISGVTIQHGHSGNIGGGLITNGRLTLVNSAILSNTVSGANDWGGGIFNSGYMTLTNSIVSGNQTGNSNAYGGGIFNLGQRGRQHAHIQQQHHRLEHERHSELSTIAASAALPRAAQTACSATSAPMSSILSVCTCRSSPGENVRKNVLRPARAGNGFPAQLILPPSGLMISESFLPKGGRSELLGCDPPGCCGFATGRRRGGRCGRHPPALRR
jgi:hypothetical protein